jgi:hypothetical protein
VREERGVADLQFGSPRDLVACPATTSINADPEVLVIRSAEKAGGDDGGFEITDGVEEGRIRFEAGGRSCAG